MDLKLLKSRFKQLSQNKNDDYYVNPIVFNIIKNIIFNYQKINKEINKIKNQNELLYKEINNIIKYNNLLLYHFKISLILIFLLLNLNFYYVFYYK